ncbi:MAG: glycosyltransferase family 1 protein [Spirochaetes bacterium]|nr:glycosyltransferase family 1 protein [Spirochaetota bacterium]
MKKYFKKILLCAMGTFGDIAPLLVYGLQLKSEGHSIAFCSANNYKNIADAYNIIFYPIDIDFDLIKDENAKAMGHSIISLLKFKQNLKKFSQYEFSTLREIIMKHDEVIASGAVLSAMSICEKHNIPYRHMLLSPAWLPSKNYTPPIFPFQISNSFLNSILWYCFTICFSLMVKKTVNKQREQLNLSRIKNVYISFIDKSFLSCSKILFPIPGKYSYLKILKPEFFFPENSNCKRIDSFVKSRKRIIYIGFGSMPIKDPDRIVRIINYVITELCLSAIIQIPDYNNNEQFNNILNINSANHKHIFPKMEIIIHHGGAGTTYSAALAGRPQIIFAHILDQYYNGSICNKKGIALPVININKFSYNALKSSLLTILNNSVYSKTAISFSKTLQRENQED